MDMDRLMSATAGNEVVVNTNAMSMSMRFILSPELPGIVG